MDGRMAAHSSSYAGAKPPQSVPEPPEFSMNPNPHPRRKRCHFNLTWGLEIALMNSFDLHLTWTSTIIKPISPWRRLPLPRHCTHVKRLSHSDPSLQSRCQLWHTAALWSQLCCYILRKAQAHAADKWCDWCVTKPQMEKHNALHVNMEAEGLITDTVKLCCYQLWPLGTPLWSLLFKSKEGWERGRWN